MSRASDELCVFDKVGNRMDDSVRKNFLLFWILMKWGVRVVLIETSTFNCAKRSTFHSCSIHSPILSFHHAFPSNSSPSPDKTIFLGILCHEWGIENIWNATVFKESKNSYHSLIHNLVLSFGVERSGVARNNIFLRQGAHAGKQPLYFSVVLDAFYQNIITVYEEFVSQNRDFSA